MGKALFLLLVGAVLVVCLVPVRGRTFWDHAQRGGIRSAAYGAVRGAIAWVRSAPRKRAVTAAAVPTGIPAGRRAPETGSDRILKAPPKERLSPGDRASLDRLVDARSR